MLEVGKILRFAVKKIASGAFRWGAAGLILGGCVIGVANGNAAFEPELAWGQSLTGKAFGILFALLCSVALGYVGVARGLAHTALYVAIEKSWARATLERIFSKLAQQVTRESLEEAPEDLAALKTDLLPLEKVRSALRSAIDQATSFVDDAYDETTQVESGFIVGRVQRFLAGKIESLLVGVMVTDGTEVALGTDPNTAPEPPNLLPLLGVRVHVLLAMIVGAAAWVRLSVRRT